MVSWYDEFIFKELSFYIGLYVYIYKLKCLWMLEEGIKSYVWLWVIYFEYLEINFEFFWFMYLFVFYYINKMFKVVYIIEKGEGLRDGLIREVFIV